MFFAATQMAVAQNIGSIRQAVNTAAPYNTVYFGIYPQTFFKTVLEAAENMPSPLSPAGPFVIVDSDIQELNGGAVPSGENPRGQATIINVEPLKWRIVKDDAEGILLFTNGNVDVQPYNDHVDNPGWTGTWDNSTLRTWLRDNFLLGQSDIAIPLVYKATLTGYTPGGPPDVGKLNYLIGTVYPNSDYPLVTGYNTATWSLPSATAQTDYFTPAEKGAIVLSSLTNPTYGANPDNVNTTDHVYLPSAADVEVVFPTEADRNSVNTRYAMSYPSTTSAPAYDDWITRSHSTAPFPGFVTQITRGTGVMAAEATGAKKAIRPALHLNPDKVLMVSEGKDLITTSPIFGVATTFAPSNTMKLTLVDGTLPPFTAASATSAVNGFVQVAFGGSLTLNCDGGTNSSDISCLLENVDGIKHYIKAANCTGSATSVTLDFTSVTSGTYTLKVFNEITNPTDKPDYATAPEEIVVYVAGGATTPPVIDATETLSIGFVGKTYNDTVKLTGSLTSPDPQFILSDGALPMGLSLNATTGRISGTLATGTAGSYPIKVKAQSPVGSDEKEFTLVVSQIVAPIIATLQADLVSAAAHIGYLSIPYDFRFLPADNTGLPSVKFTKTSGNLPDGLTLEENGRLHGMPTAVQTQNFTICAETEGTYDYHSYTISILAYNPLAPAPPDFVTTDLGTSAQVRENTLFTDVFIQITGSQYIDVQYDPTTFPTGMTFDPSAKRIFGTPILGSAGTYQLHFWAKNPATKPILATGPDSIGILYTLTVLPVDVPMITTPAALPAAAQGMPYDEQLDTDIPATLSLTGLLPPGMSFTSPDEIDGTPTTPGTYTFTVKASNADGYSTKAFTLEVQSPLPPPIIDPVTLPDGTAGDNYVGATVTATNSPTLWTWTGAPPGLSLNNSGIISGMPTTAGTYTVSIMAENAWDPALVSQTATIVIHPAPTSIPPAFVYVLPDGEPGTAYSERVSPIARPDVTWSIADGRLPQGLTLSDDGVISGTPTSSGSYKFTVKVVSNGGEFADVTKTLEIVIATHMGNSSIARMITIPAIPGAITVPGAGRHTVPSGSDYSILLTPIDELYKMLTPQVRSNRTQVADAEGIVVTPNGDGTYTILIKGIQEPVDLTVDFTQAAGTVDDTKLWSAGNRLYIHAVHSGEARVYSVTGVLVKGLTVVADETYTTTLPAGIYLVVLDNGKVYKVVLK
jgi:hypothetical protein